MFLFLISLFYGDTDINGELPDPGKLVLFCIRLLPAEDRS
jgi:hypothetical protein